MTSPYPTCLTDLITTSGPRRIYPTDETISTHLQSRTRSEQPTTRLGPSGIDLVHVNPLRALSNLDDRTANEYVEEIRRTDGGSAGAQALGASVYEQAGKVWLLATRTKKSQAVIYRGLTGSGKSTALKHFTSQLIRLSTTTRDQRRIGDNIEHALSLLEAFGHFKSPLNPSASAHSRTLEIHLDSRSGTLVGARFLTWGLDKSRLNRLVHDERSFHVFYQMLAGASREERDALNLDEPSAYNLLASSGCYRLPGGPFSDDVAAMGQTRAALASLGFKPKHTRSTFSLLAAILLLSNLNFIPSQAVTGGTTVSEPHLMVEIAGHLGVSSDELERILTNRTLWVRRELCSVVLDPVGSSDQRDVLMRDLYAILFSFVVEMANKRLAPPTQELNHPPNTIIVQLDTPGFRSRTDLDPDSNTSHPSSQYHRAPLIDAGGQNGLPEFSNNFADEWIRSYVLRRAFDDSMADSARMIADGLKLPDITVDVDGCIQLLRGPPTLAHPRGLISILADCSESLKGENSDQVKSDTVLSALGPLARDSHLSFPPITTSSPRRTFAITHHSGVCNYAPEDFAEKQSDVIDAQLVSLLRSSSEPFVAKLVSGPGIATEAHPLDDSVIVQAQVSITPLRHPHRLAPSLNGRDRSGGDDDDEDDEDENVVDWPIDLSIPQPVTTQMDAALSTILSTFDDAQLWTISCIRPNNSGYPNTFDKRLVRSQIRSLGILDLIARRQFEYVASLSILEFIHRHSCAKSDGQNEDAIVDFAETRGWIRGKDYECGREYVWMGWRAWREQEDLLRSEEKRRGSEQETLGSEDDDHNVLDTPPPLPKNMNQPDHQRRGSQRYMDMTPGGESTDNLLRKDPYGYPPAPFNSYERYHDDPTLSKADLDDSPSTFTVPSGNAGGGNGPGGDGMIVHEKTLLTGQGHKSTTQVVATTPQRRWWLRITWILTWWVPSWLLTHVGKMKRADVRMAWREKLAICIMIALMCGIVIFYIIGFGLLLCPNSDKAWNTNALATHQGTNDYYAAIRGIVYDFTSFYKGQHSDISAYPTSADVMLEFAGQDLTNYFPMPMTIACPGLVNDTSLSLQYANFTPILSYAIHTSGPLQTINGTKLDNINWYNDVLQPSLQQYWKGYFVWEKSDIAAQAADDTSKYWAIYQNNVYDLSNYIYTVNYYSSSSGTDLPNYSFLNSSLSSLFQESSGQDITTQMNKILAGMTSDEASQTMTCLNNAFYIGQIDFTKEPRCTVQNYLLLAFSIVLVTTIASKFFAALQLGSKRNPELLDKFVICQVPCYTEGEESLKRTIDSLAALNYDDKRKLLFVICDGNIIGAGNNRPTPRIVLDILGVDPRLDPEPLLFKSIGEGSRQLNYGKVYSGLYEHEGHVVPYLVVVKVGKPTETSKPGNRGKRDSQVLLLQYLNRVHFDAPMCPLELEIYHQMRNIIGIDPTFYEYIFQVDADTTVQPDSLNRLVSCASDDSKIIGICGETKLANERESWTTMIQVYEYYISHHLTKAFESLFGSVTCLPGCFSVYRIRTADKGRPVIISSIVIDEYAEPNVDTLHKKNLFSLGEDRYLTTLMMKHFPTYKMKFTPDAIAHTVAPSSWNVLLSQRRRWINSTIHNLVELLFLPEMCGFCFFSMRFIVFIDLLGTIILPATCIYLIYLIVIISTRASAIPTVSLIMIGAVYGLQAIIFILKREFMLIGWMIVYILAFPIYSIFLPCYSFWSMDDFSWGTTRKVIGEGNNKTIVYEDDEPFEDSMIPYRTFKDYEAYAWETASLHSDKQHPASLGLPRGRQTVHHSRGPSVNSSVSNLPPGADYWRDSSPLGPSHSTSNLRHASSRGSLAAPNLYPDPNSRRVTSIAGLSQWGPGSFYDLPNAMPPAPPFMGMPMNPFESPASSHSSLLRPSSAYPPGGAQTTYPPPPQPQHSGMSVPRNSVMSMAGIGYGLPPPSIPFANPNSSMNNRMSSYSLATTANPFGSNPPVPSENPEPSDEEVIGKLRNYLQSQDLMSVTKRTAREGIYALFPRANLQSRAGWINKQIDQILSE